jgi:hypothetical protein
MLLLLLLLLLTWLLQLKMMKSWPRMLLLAAPISTS